MAEKYFPELCESNGDVRAELLFDDGVAYMANCAPGSVDVVIVDSTDPVGPAEGLFNKAFFESCFRALKDDGLLVQQSESPLALLDLIKDMRSEMGKAGFQSFKTLPFPQPCYPTGWWSVTVASKQAGYGFGFRQEDAAAKPFDTLYYTAPLHTGVLVSPPFVAKALGE
ncbi:Spermidine synthase [compost metagenome]